jgi:two-component system response regulator
MSAVKILVVDDNTADISLLRVALDEHEQKYELRILNTGDEALRFIEAQRDGLNEPDLCIILLDLHLPRYDGLAVLRGIRQVATLSHIQVIVLSGSASPAERREISAMGAIYREKPFDIQGFCDLGAEILAICKGYAVAA